MSSRKEQKEQARKQRLEAEQAAAAKDARRKRLGYAGAALAAVAAVAVAVVLVTSSGGDSGDGPSGASDTGSNVALPERKETDLAAAAKAAGCEVRTTESEGRDHVSEKVSYKSNPPTSGPHDPVPAEDGIYDPGNSPTTEASVHALEHGRIVLQHASNLPAADRAKLEAIANEQLGPFAPGYHMLVLENMTKMPYAIAATAWTQVLGCDALTPESIDAIRAFRERYTDKGPEFVP